jgi:PKD repeat protein
VRSVNGPEATFIDGGRLVRCISVAQPSAVLDGFTLCNGYAVGGAGAYMTDGTVQNCIIRNNRDDGTANGGGVWMSLGTLRDCVVVGNRAGHGTYGVGRGGGIAISGGAIENCTVSRNSAGLSEGGIYRTAGAIVNTIIYDNRAPSAFNINSVAGVTNSCAPELTSGVGNITGDPRFLDTGRGCGADLVGGNFRLGIGSPCIDAGLAMASFSNDLDTLTRPVDGNGDATPAWDIGAYEVAMGPAEGALRCSFQASTNSGFAPFSPLFTAGVAGTNLGGAEYYWDFDGDGLSETNGSGNTATATYPTAGWYTVILTVSNSAGELGACIRTNYVQMPMDVAYVSTNGTRVPPYTSWDTAANDIYSAVDEIAGTNNPTVNVSNGTYAVTAQIVLNKGVTVHSVASFTNTIVRRSGAGLVRVFNISHSGAVLDGVTVSNGSLNTASGAGISMSAGTVRNCSIRNNTADYGSGGGLNMTGGQLLNSIVDGNRCWGHGYNGEGAGICMNNAAIVSNCVIRNNSNDPSASFDTGRGGGVLMYSANNQLVDCLISNNLASSNFRPIGGGVYMVNGTISRCVLAKNRTAGAARIDAVNHWSAGAGVAMDAGTIRGCLVVGNSAEAYGPNRDGGGVKMTGGRMENCTVVRNTNVMYCGGVYLSGAATVSNSIVYFNSAAATNNIVQAGVSFSCAPELTGATGNQAGDPMFKDAGGGYGTSSMIGNYRLKSSSPGYNSGMNANWMTNALDLDGTDRIQGGTVDMGAYETPITPGSVFRFR